jgi:hypothetical protein
MDPKSVKIKDIVNRIDAEKMRRLKREIEKSHPDVAIRQGGVVTTALARIDEGMDEDSPLGMDPKLHLVASLHEVTRLSCLLLHEYGWTLRLLTLDGSRNCEVSSSTNPAQLLASARRCTAVWTEAVHTLRFILQALPRNSASCRKRQTKEDNPLWLLSAPPAVACAGRMNVLKVVWIPCSSSVQTQKLRSGSVQIMVLMA